MSFVAVYAISVGLLMIVQWIFFFATGQIPEFKTAPAGILFHLLAEAATALALIAGGLGSLKKRIWGPRVLPVALGMLVYTLIASSGYFVEKHVWPPVVMFAVLFVLTMASLRAFFRVG